MLGTNNSNGKGKLISQGDFSAVYCQEKGGEIVAVKEYTERAEKRFEKELFFLKLFIDHPHIIQCLSHSVIDRTITLEWAAKGTLFDQIIAQRNKSQPDYASHRAKYLLDLGKALSFLKANNVIHRDIKPSNVLITQNDDAKLSDFEFARQLEPNKTDHRSPNKDGTVPYMAPEITRGSTYENASFSYASDLWAFGITLWMTYSLGGPYRQCYRDNQYHLSSLKNAHFVGITPDQTLISDAPVQELMVKIWDFDPHKRAKIEQVLPVLQNLHQSYSTGGKKPG
jgi:serine/threonine protein kinase